MQPGRTPVVQAMMLAMETVHRAGRETLSSAQANHLLETGGQLVDVRSPEEFARDALPGACPRIVIVARA